MGFPTSEASEDPPRTKLYRELAGLAEIREKTWMVISKSFLYNNLRKLHGSCTDPGAAENRRNLYFSLPVAAPSLQAIPVTAVGQGSAARGDDLNQIALDLKFRKGDTPPSRMLCSEMDSWGRAAPARVKEDETYRGLLHPVPP